MRAITNKDGSITLTADSGADAFLLAPFWKGIEVRAYWQSAPVSLGDRITTYPRLTIRPLGPQAIKKVEGA